jgi:hypothetical protein
LSVLTCPTIVTGFEPAQASMPWYQLPDARYRPGHPSASNTNFRKPMPLQILPHRRLRSQRIVGMHMFMKLIEMKQLSWHIDVPS